LKSNDDLVKTYTSENDTVLDPFLGSGTTAIACLHNNRNCIGYELNTEYFKMAKDNLDKCKNIFDTEG
jgi:site-specific DNA-methyltransferase (adenine-specific)